MIASVKKKNIEKKIFYSAGWSEESSSRSRKKRSARLWSHVIITSCGWGAARPHGCSGSFRLASANLARGLKKCQSIQGPHLAMFGVPTKYFLQENNRKRNRLTNTRICSSASNSSTARGILTKHESIWTLSLTISWINIHFSKFVSFVKRR